jgi:hypothetical protein
LVDECAHVRKCTDVDSSLPLDRDGSRQLLAEFIKTDRLLLAEMNGCGSLIGELLCIYSYSIPGRAREQIEAGLKIGRLREPAATERAPIVRSELRRFNGSPGRRTRTNTDQNTKKNIPIETVGRQLNLLPRSFCITWLNYKTVYLFFLLNQTCYLSAFQYAHSLIFSPYM